MNSALEIVLTIFHVLIAISLIGLVLIQDSKSGAMGVLGTGNSSSLLGATGATTLAAKMTRWAGVLFAGTCITLAIMSSRSDKSVLDGVPTTQSAPATQQAAPAATPEAAPATAPAPTTSESAPETNK